MLDMADVEPKVEYALKKGCELGLKGTPTYCVFTTGGVRITLG